MSGEFSVYWDDDQGETCEELRFVDAETAMSRVTTLIRGPAAMIGIVRRVIITDGGDCTNFEWKHGEGIVFPPRDEKEKV